MDYSESFLRNDVTVVFLESRRPQASDSSSEEDDDDDDDVESVSLDKYGIRSSDSNPLTVGLHVTGNDAAFLKVSSIP